MRRAAPLLVAFALTSSTARAEPLEVIAQDIVGGRVASDAMASTTATIGTCDATLVAPSLLVTAAHCLEDGPTQAQFGASAISATRTVAITRCAAHPDYVAGVDADLAFCTLSEPVTSLTPAAVASACEEVPASLWLVGHGYSTGAEQGDRIARQVEVQVDAVQDDDREIVVGDDDHGACHGDSGGSAFGDDGAQLVGVISRRGPAADGGVGEDCASTTVITALAPYVDWLQQASGVDLNATCDQDDVWSGDNSAYAARDCSDDSCDTPPSVQRATVHSDGCSLVETRDSHWRDTLLFVLLLFAVVRRVFSAPTGAAANRA